jgi:hypothetical protein
MMNTQLLTSLELNYHDVIKEIKNIRVVHGSHSWAIFRGLYSPPPIPGGILRNPQDFQESQE